MSKATPEVSVPVVQAVAGAILAANLVYPAVILGMRSAGILGEEGLGGLPPDTARILTYALFAAGVVTVLISFPVRKVLERIAVPDDVPVLFHRMRAIVVVLAIADAAGVMAFVLALLTGEILGPALLWGLAIGAGILHFPTRAWLER